jgi:hypothetical protein
MEVDDGNEQIEDNLPAAYGKRWQEKLSQAITIH